MTEDFKKWLCGKAGEKFEDLELEIGGFKAVELEILIKAMWAINRENHRGKNQFQIHMGNDGVDVIPNIGEEIGWSYSIAGSEQTALEKALEYVMENSR